MTVYVVLSHRLAKQKLMRDVRNSKVRTQYKFNFGPTRVAAIPDIIFFPGKGPYTGKWEGVGLAIQQCYIFSYCQAHALLCHFLV